MEGASRGVFAGVLVHLATARATETPAHDLFAGVKAWQGQLGTPTAHAGNCSCLMRLAALDRPNFDQISADRERCRPAAPAAGSVPERKRSVGPHNHGGGKWPELAKGTSAGSGGARGAKGPARPAAQATLSLIHI